MRDKAVAMLTALGVAGAADDPLLDMVLTNVQWRIKNLSNLSEIPEGWKVWPFLWPWANT